MEKLLIGLDFGSDSVRAVLVTENGEQLAAGVHEYTRCLAAYVRHAGVRVNCVIPGNINTPRTRELYGGDRITPTPGLSSLEHVGTPEDIASLVLFLCSEGGRYISGQCIRVDGGEQLFPC